MKVASFEAVIRALNDAGVPYIIVGGVAVIAHGYGRATRDIDVVVQLQPRAIEKTFIALKTLGYEPRVPVSADQFADPKLRHHWAREKGMQVPAFHSNIHPETPVDLFVTEPFDFEDEYRTALIQEIAPGLPLRLFRVESLLRMKAEAGRQQDLADIDELNLLYLRKSSHD